MSDCQWERFKATAAPMASQQRQVQVCSCNPCRNARLLSVAKMPKPFGVKSATAERLDVLAWSPEPPPSEDEAP